MTETLPPTPAAAGPRPVAGPALGDADLSQLAAVGIGAAEAERQLALLRTPPAAVRLVRPCTAGDGIERIPAERQPSLRARHAAARDGGRLAKLVPASGAASRMFKSLLAWRASDATPAETRAEAESGDDDAREVVRFFDGLDRLALRHALAASLAGRGDDLARALAGERWRDVAAALLDDDGLGAAAAPKGLLPFHDYPAGPRTAFAEHLAEGAQLLRDRDGVCRLHFTVAPERRDDFARELAASAPAIAAHHGARFEVGFSSQDPATDTLAIEPDGTPFRLADGRLLLRPGGHGALLRNLAALAAEGDGDVVFLKNIDNVVREERLPATLRWRELLCGRLLELEAEVRARLRRLEARDTTPADVESARALLAHLGERLPADRETLRGALRRPLRVAGMVANQGEPGGGPFWVADAAGRVSRQIVESSQVDRSDPQQEAIFQGSTHFNPVDVVASLRDPYGEPYDLAGFVDPAAAFVARKSEGGRELLALEHPGLWNGAMAGWITVFVEIPVACFAPVKTVVDLLRPEHQPG